MAKVNTDPKLIEELLTRGVENIYPNIDMLRQKLLSGDRIRLYCGYDPSAPSLHIGNAISINKMAQFQKLGHEVIFLIGSFTGMIGDPSDKKAARRQLSREEVLVNAKNFQMQASNYLDFMGNNAAQVKYNNEWSDKVSFKDLISLASNFTVQKMITRDMFQERLKEEKPIFLHEFLYPLAQAYDSVAMDVDLEIGGNDQMFNMLCGRDLLKALKNKEKAVLTLKLLVDDSGKKMGKSEGNIVSLDEEPEQMYGKIMSWSDGVLSSAFELCTNVSSEELEKIQVGLKNGSLNPRDLKMRLALEVTKINHGEEAAMKAQDNFIKTVQNKELPEEIEKKIVVEDSLDIVSLLCSVGLADSKSEARRLVAQGGIKIGSRNELIVVSDQNEVVNISDNLIIQRGKRMFVEIIKK